MVSPIYCVKGTPRGSDWEPKIVRILADVRHNCKYFCEAARRILTACSGLRSIENKVNLATFVGGDLSEIW